MFQNPGGQGFFAPLQGEHLHPAADPGLLRHRVRGKAGKPRADRLNEHKPKPLVNRGQQEAVHGAEVILRVGRLAGEDHAVPNAQLCRVFLCFLFQRAVPHIKEEAFRLFLFDLGKGFQQETGVFLGGDPPHMAQDKFAFYSQLFPHLLPLFRGIGKPGKVDGIFNYLEIRPVIQKLPGDP